MDTSIEMKIREQVDRLRRCSCQEIEREVAQKRMVWFREHGHRSGKDGPPTPRQAFEMLFFAYMGLPEADLPVVSETNTEITWLSCNPCPTLEACKETGLDTRRICRAAYEKSTQALVSQLDPRLRFLRSYREIRPYAEHCREWIARVDFEAMMDIAIQEAQRSRREGNKGYGAVLALGNQIVAQAHDTAVTANDPSQHAELNAIRQAVQALGDSNLSGGILFSTCEPCPMCASLAVWANLTTIVYGASIEETARLGNSRIRISVNEIVEKSPAMIEVIGGVLHDRCLSLYQ